MLYYLALTWNPDNSDQTAFATRKKLALLERKEPNWQVALDTKGMVILYHIVGENILYDIGRLPDEKGVIIGKLFKRSYINEHSAQHTPDPVALDQKLADRLISSEGRALIKNFWGGYIAFLVNHQTKQRWILRDPTGELPCQHALLRDVDVYFVRLEDFEMLSPPSLTLNTHFITGLLVFRSLCRRETGFKEIVTILPGECACHDGPSSEISNYWSAIEISKTDPIYDYREAIDLSRHTLRSCVHAWASCFDGVVLSLSGGLDSSIVLTCLNDAPNNPKILCRNYYSPDAPNADERIYARSVANKYGHEITHIQTDESLDEDFDPTHIRSMFPSGWPMDINEHLEDDENLKKHGFSAEFYGHGGDELFCRGSSIPLSVDQAWVYGINSSLLGTVNSDARIRKSSYWRIMKLVDHYGIRKNKWHMKHAYLTPAPPLIDGKTHASVMSDPSHWHPLFATSADLPPAKFEHAFLLTYGLASAHVGINTPYPLPARSPLKSQPLIELCLRIFMPLHQHNGIDRSIVRQAFMKDLPESISHRSSKAHGTQKIKNLLENKIDDVRSHLIGGQLMGLGLLDDDAIIQYLQSQPTSIQAETLQICRLMSIEMWLRRLQ